jgi:hypothetical protein
MPDNIQIITRGDDCGSSHSANLGIVEAFISRLEVLQPGQYLFHAHPAVDSSELRVLGNKDTSGEHLAATRSMDIRLFTDPCVLACYERRHILPLRYDQAERVRSRLPRPGELPGNG